MSVSPDAHNCQHVSSIQNPQVVNLREVEGLAKAGVVFYGINISVGISVSLPGFGSDLAHGIPGNLP